MSLFVTFRPPWFFIRQCYIETQFQKNQMCVCVCACMCTCVNLSLVNFTKKGNCHHGLFIVDRDLGKKMRKEYSAMQGYWYLEKKWCLKWYCQGNLGSLEKSSRQLWSGKITEGWPPQCCFHLTLLGPLMLPLAPPTEVHKFLKPKLAFILSSRKLCKDHKD